MRTTYSREFKLRAVARAKRGDCSVRQLENELGLSENLLRHWLQEYDKMGERAWIRAVNLDESTMPSPEAAVAGEAGQEAGRLHTELRTLQRQVQQLEQENAILSKSLDALECRTSVKYTLVESLEQDHPVTTLCKVLKAPRSGYYEWRKHAPTLRAV